MCHEDEAPSRDKSFHRNLSCEGCHGPGRGTPRTPTALKPPAPRDRKFCPVCHAYDASRPTGFPQINPTAHNPLKPCITCHNPHDPVPPKTPKACSACHAQIERTKAVSSHALLSLHDLPHRRPSSTRRRRGPRCRPSRRPGSSAPVPREGLAAKEPPKIDVTTHGTPYLCWQCHYPHLPEGR